MAWDPRLRPLRGNSAGPRLHVRIEPATKTLAEVVGERGAPCGSTHFTGARARGMSLEEAVPRVGLICLHYPCLASMQPSQTAEGVQTIIHLSGRLFNEGLAQALPKAGYSSEVAIDLNLPEAQIRPARIG